MTIHLDILLHDREVKNDKRKKIHYTKEKGARLSSAPRANQIAIKKRTMACLEVIILTFHRVMTVLSGCCPHRIVLQNRTFPGKQETGSPWFPVDTARQRLLRADHRNRPWVCSAAGPRDMTVPVIHEAGNTITHVIDLFPGS